MRLVRSFDARGVIVAPLVIVALARSAAAIYIDEQQNWSLRARIYSQGSIRIQESETDTVPPAFAGQLVQQRNFYNPELDVKLTDYTAPMRKTFLEWLAPDELRMRVAAWGFYDGIYDYGSSQFGNSAARINKNYPDLTVRTSAFFLQGDDFNCPRRGSIAGIGEGCVGKDGRPLPNVQASFPGVTVLNPRSIYANQNRINELYLSYSKGPVFVRLGRQAISWGESDTIALLDQNNPFDTTLAAPGVFEDLDEARIPLWTLRGSFNLFNNWGPFSSAFVEAYWVPGFIDTNVGFLPMLTASPYSPRGQDPQTTVDQLTGGLPFQYQFILLDRTPDQTMSNSRWGVRLQTVVARDYTVSAWYYKTFPNAPVPVSLGTTAYQNPQGPGRIFGYTTQTVHLLTDVVGAGTTFFVEPLDGIARINAVYFINEPGFIPQLNLGACSPAPGQPIPPLCDPSQTNPLSLLTFVGSVPKADILRWELGFDRFFFIRALNPTNSFTFVSALVGGWNLSETSQRDFRFNGIRVPGKVGDSPDDFVNLNKVDAFVQFTLQTDYMHGKLQPRMTTIINRENVWVFHPSLTYRYSDSLLFGLDFIGIVGDFYQVGFFRDRGQVAGRVTYQLN
jgi:hypothetical protein